MDQIVSFDFKMSQWLQLPVHSKWWRGARIVAHLGDGPYVFSTLALVYGVAWLLNDPALQQADAAVTVGVIATMVVVTAIKFAVRRQRPAEPGEFAAFHYDVYSFPSGHAARMAALSVGVLFFYAWLGAALILLSLSVALARVIVGVHFLGDIIFGLCTGAAVVWGSNTLLTALFL